MQFTEFKNQVVLLTGVASGIGRAQAVAFLEQGAQVFGVDCNETGILATAAFKNNDRFRYLIGDIQDLKTLEFAFQMAQNNFGPIDILLNTAGKLDAYVPTLKTDEALWDEIMTTNLKSIFRLTNLVLPSMLERKKGILINMASIAGLIAGGGGAAYTASKHAIIGYTKQLDYDYAAQGIRANAIAPGAIKTPMNAADFVGDAQMAQWVAEQTPAKRWAEPSEVADLTLFLASRHADYIHGTVLPIDGGWLEK